MTSTEHQTPPKKGTVWEHATRKDWKGDPQKYTVTTTRQGIIYSEDEIGDRIKISVGGFQKQCTKIVYVPEPTPAVTSPKLSRYACARLHTQAHQAGMTAGENAIPVPMTVTEHQNPLDDTSPITHRYAPINDGVCGFASVSIRPGTSTYARWIRNNNFGYTASIGGGTNVRVREFGQSLTRKAAYADAYAAVLRAAGITAYSENRLD